MNTEKFKLKSIQTHNQKYDYSDSNYINARTKIKILCNKCQKYFWQQPNNHMDGQGCPHCKRKKLSVALSDSKNTFILKAKKIHRNKYNYDKINYSNSKTKITIQCNKCSEFFNQLPHSHLTGIGCPQCGGNKRYNTNTLIEKFNHIHGDKFNYKDVLYSGVKNHVLVKCNACFLKFKVTPDNHINAKSGCPVCSKNNKSEDFLFEIIRNLYPEYKYLRNYKPKFLNKMEYDIYIPSLKIAIEYDGEQHFKSIKKFGGEFEFEKILKRDKSKNILSSDNNITLIRINYKQISYRSSNKNVKEFIIEFKNIYGDLFKSDLPISLLS